MAQKALKVKEVLARNRESVDLNAQLNEAVGASVQPRQDKADPLGDKLLFDEPAKKQEEGKKEDSSKAEPVKEMPKREEKKPQFEPDEDGYIQIEETVKQTNEKVNKEYFHIKIPKPDLISFERIVLYIIIIFLVILLFKNPFMNLFSGLAHTLMPGTANPADITTAVAAVSSAGFNDALAGLPNPSGAGSALTTAAAASSGRKIWAIRNGACVQVGIEEDVDRAYGTASQCQAALSGGVATQPQAATTQAASLTTAVSPAPSSVCRGGVNVQITNVVMDSANNRTIKSIDVTIKNQNNTDLTSYMLNLMFYNADTPNDVKYLSKLKDPVTHQASKLTYNTVVPRCTGSVKITLTQNDLVSKYVSSRNIANIFAATIENAEGEVIGTSNQYILAKAS